MKRLTGLFLLVVLLLLPASMRAQELDCDVAVDHTLLTDVDYTYLDDLGREMQEYLNTRTWTDDAFLPFERVDCQVEVVFTEAVAQQNYTAQLAISMRRPIYGTTQTTAIVRFSDPGWQFSYTRGAPLIYEPQSYDALTSVLDFYAYMLLGYDYDTFSELGGTEFFERARRIAERAASIGGADWSSSDGRGRRDLVEDLLTQRFEPLRIAYFNYHYGGLDHFVTETAEARANVLDVLRDLEELSANVTRRYPLDLFFSAKFEEMIAIFEESPLSGDAYDLLTTVDPSHFSRYQELVSY